MDFEVQALAMVRYVEGRPDWPVSDSRVDNLHCVPFFLGGGQLDKSNIYSEFMNKCMFDKKVYCLNSPEEHITSKVFPTGGNSVI